MGALVGVVGCAPRPSVRYGGIRISSNENQWSKNREWFRGLYRDCVDRDYAAACFKTGRNVEDGVEGRRGNADDAHWFYAKACLLQPSERHCQAAERTDPKLRGRGHSHAGHSHEGHEHEHE